MIYYIISFIVGSIFGMFTMSLCVIAKKSDEQIAKLMKEHTKNNNPKQMELF